MNDYSPKPAIEHTCQVCGHGNADLKLIGCNCVLHVVSPSSSGQNPLHVGCSSCYVDVDFENF